MSRQQNWRTKDTITAKFLMRNTLVQHPVIKDALNRYLSSLNLQGQVNQGIMTENQALIAFEKALHRFSRALHSALNERYSHNELDQTDLTNPIVMQTELNNPLSFINQMINDCAMATAFAIENEVFENAQANNLQAEEILAAQNAYDADVQYNAMITAVIAIEELPYDAEPTKDAIEAAFFKNTGLKSDFHKVEEEKAHESDSTHQYEPKPKYHTEPDKEK